MTIGDIEGLLSIAGGKAMMQNKISRFRVEAMADLLTLSTWEGLGCFFGKHGLAEPSFRTARTSVCRFSILAFLQECVRGSGIVGLLVRSIFCAGPTEGVRWDAPWAAAGEDGCAL
jgi:hypothetical protein